MATGYQSIYGSSGASNTPSDGNYHSMYGYATQANPTAKQLAQTRLQQHMQDSANFVKQQQSNQPKQSLFSKVASVAKPLVKGAVAGEQAAATGIARVLPGGTADIQANQQQSAQAEKDLQFVKQQQAAGKVPNIQAAKLINAIAKNAAGASKQQAATVKAMPSKGQLAAGFGSTAADILTAGELPEIKAGLIGAKTAKVATTVAHEASFAGAGALNAKAGGGNKNQIEENALLGGAVPLGANLLGHFAPKVVSKVGDKIANSDNRVAKAVTRGANNAKAVVGNSAPAKSLIQNQKAQTLLHYEPKNPKVQALIADREKQAEAMAAPGKAAEAEQSRVANETEKTQATGQKIDRQVELIKAKKADNAGELSNVDQVKLQHLQEDKKQLPTTSTPTVEKTPEAVPESPTGKIGNDRSNVTGAPTEPEAKPVSETPKEPTPKSATVTEPATTKAVVDPNAPPEQGTSKIAQDIQTKAVAKSLTDNYGELSQYNKINVANEADKAVKFVNGDKEDVMKVISGEKPLPSNLRATAVIKAVEEHPEYSKDGEVLKALAKSPLNTESSRSAQELRLAAERDQNSAVNKINELSKTREDAFKTRTGKTVAKATNDEVRQIREAVPKVATTKETFSSFVDSLKC